MIVPIALFYLSLARAKLGSKKHYGIGNIFRVNLFLFAPLLPGFSMTLTALLVLYYYGWIMNGMDREATVAYDLKCSVVHISLSPGQNYLDVDMFGRALRIARMWFSS